MTLAEKLKEKTMAQTTSKDKIFEEIVYEFDKYLDSKFESYLEKSINQEDISKGYKFLYMTFWEYKIGSPSTNFDLAGYKFEGDIKNKYTYESAYYKGIRLKDIQEEVILACNRLLEKKLKEMGFKVIQKQIPNNLGFLGYKIKVIWA